jgi:hypothetical protein
MYYPEEPGYIRAGHFADQFVTRNGAPVFHCYAQIFRIPVRGKEGYAALQIHAHHSVAVEAAATFLTTSDSVRNISTYEGIGLPGVPVADKRVAGTPDALRANLDELGVVIRITCTLAEPEALALKPGVPRHLLHIENIELVHVVRAEYPSELVYDPDKTEAEQPSKKKNSGR